jgi:TAT (twin-arginine translocation) pathway signal sequence
MAMTTDRRSFLKSAAAVTAAAAIPVQPLAAAEQERPAPSPRALNEMLLAALGDAVLPESLGAATRATAVREFNKWITEYSPVAEEMHGYGDAEITYTPADPAPGWNAQLEALDLLARRTKRRGFAALSIAARRDIVRRQLVSVRGAALPSNPLVATHVAVALLSHWASSYAAQDLAYDSRIMRGECRGLAGVTRKPLPLVEGRVD